MKVFVKIYDDNGECKTDVSYECELARALVIDGVQRIGELTDSEIGQICGIFEDSRRRLILAKEPVYK